METEKEIRQRMRTNRDRLKEMSNHEFAEWLNNDYMPFSCRYCNFRETVMCKDGNCMPGTELWLSSEEEKR